MARSTLIFQRIRRKYGNMVIFSIKHTADAAQCSQPHHGSIIVVVVLSLVVLLVLILRVLPCICTLLGVSSWLLYYHSAFQCKRTRLRQYTRARTRAHSTHARTYPHPHPHPRTPARTRTRARTYTEQTQTQRRTLLRVPLWPLRLASVWVGRRIAFDLSQHQYSEPARHERATATSALAEMCVIPF